MPAKQTRSNSGVQAEQQRSTNEAVAEQTSAVPIKRACEDLKTLDVKTESLFNAQSDLHKYSWNHRLPELIWQSAEAAENKHWANYCTLSDMQSALLKAQMQLTARPFLWDCEDGTWVEVVGLLPNGERTSTNEAQALQMYKAYCVAKAYEIPEPIELPF